MIEAAEGNAAMAGGADQRQASSKQQGHRSPANGARRAIAAPAGDEQQQHRADRKDQFGQGFPKIAGGHQCASPLADATAIGLAPASFESPPCQAGSTRLKTTPTSLRIGAMKLSG